jgi:hypothetical protein
MCGNLGETLIRAVDRVSMQGGNTRNVDVRVERAIPFQMAQREARATFSLEVFYLNRKNLIDVKNSYGAVAGPAPSCRVPIPISITVFFGNTTSFPRATKCKYTDSPAPYAPIV